MRFHFKFLLLLFYMYLTIMYQLYPTFHVCYVLGFVVYFSLYSLACKCTWIFLSGSLYVSQSASHGTSIFASSRITPLIKFNGEDQCSCTQYKRQPYAYHSYSITRIIFNLTRPLFSRRCNVSFHKIGHWLIWAYIIREAEFWRSSDSALTFAKG